MSQPTSHSQSVKQDQTKQLRQQLLRMITSSEAKRKANLQLACFLIRDR